MMTPGSQRLPKPALLGRTAATADAASPRGNAGLYTPGRAGAVAMMFLWFVQKMRQALSFLATFQNDHPAMKTLAIISILALLTISGAAYTDQLLTSDQQTQRVN
jgi:hypothetical protein